MARDYKNARPKKTTSKTAKKKTKKKITKKTTRAGTKTVPVKRGIPAWLWFIGGMLCMFTYFQWQKNSAPEVITNPTTETVEPYTSRDAELSESTDIPIVIEDKQPEFEIKKDPRFTFYEELPKNEVIIPEEALVDVDKNTINDEPIEATTKAGTYILQAGSFKNFADADRRKAELALYGLQTSIQKVAINGTPWYRVRIGPITDLTILNTTRQDLRSSGVDVLVLRVD